MAANPFLISGVATLFSLVAPAHALSGPDDWNDFSNNFATDLAPILVLFGEQASKQFLSESTSIWDSIIFGIAPIGVITAVVSVIRLYGSSSLKALIGRAQEAHGVAEAELCSSTSDDVCELWSNGGICRVFGRPLILEFFRVTPGPNDFYHRFESGTVDTRRPPSCGLYLPKTLLCANGYNITDWVEIGAAEAGGVRDFAPHPNLSLNIGIKPLPRQLLRIIAALGTLLQLSFFAYATWVTFYYPELYEEDGLPGLWSFCLTTVGMTLLVIGMICCAILVDGRSAERQFRFLNNANKAYPPYQSKPNNNITMFWLQPGNQRAAVDSPRRPGASRLARPGFGLGVAIGSSCCGFVCQFVGLRGLHGSVALYQLAVTLCMAIVRALLRSRRLGADQNKLKLRRDLDGHELDWQASNIERERPMMSLKASGWFIDDLPSPLKSPNDSRRNPGLHSHDYGVNVAPGTRGLAGFYAQQQRNFENPYSVITAVSWVKLNEWKDPQPNEAARILHYRASLSYMTGGMIQAEEEKWNTKIREVARRLKNALQEAAKHVFSDMALLKGWKESTSLVWSTTCRLHEPFTMSADENSTARPESLPIHFSMHHVMGRWEISECQLEAALSLWLWSIRHLGALDRISRRKAFMAERRERRDDLVSAIRLWATQTHGIDTDPVKLAQLASENRASMLDSQMPYEFLTTLSVPLMMATRPDPWNFEVLDGLISQDIFAIFISRIADIMHPLIGAESWTRRRQISASGGEGVTEDQLYLGLTNTHVGVLANTVVSSGIGSREDALMTLPTTSEVMRSLLREAKGLRRKNQLIEAENLLRWLMDNVPRELQERARFGTVGFEAMSAMETLSEGWRIFDESKRAISDYVTAWGLSRRAKAKRDDAGAIVDTGWAISTKCPELIEDMWSSDHIRELIASAQKNSSANGPGLLPWAVDHKVDEETLETLFDWPGLDLSLHDDGIKAVISASASGYYVGVDLLLQHGVRLHGSGGSALPLAVRNKHRCVVFRLLSVRAHQIEARHCTRALHSAIKWDNDIVKLLLNHRADPNAPGVGGRTALHVATLEGNTAVVEELLRCGAQMEKEDDHGANSLDIAVLLRRRAILGLLIDPNSPQSTIKKFLPHDWASKGETVIDISNYQTPPLIAAAEQGLEEIAEAHLEAGADPNVLTSDQNNSPLHAAIRAGNDRIITAILNPHYWADLNLKIITGQTPLALAVELGQYKTIEKKDSEVVDLLLREGADPNTKDGNGRTPLLAVLEAEAIEHNPLNEVIVERLLHSRARPDERNANKTNTPLHAALRSGNLSIISTILGQLHGADINVTVHERPARAAPLTPLALAVELDQPQSVRLLIIAGAIPDAEAKYGSLLHAAAKQRYVKIVNLLLAAKEDTEAKDQAECTPLLATLISELSHHHTENEDIVESLLRAGADANAAVGGGANVSALHIAVQSGNKTMVKLLIENHANVEVRNREGLTPLLAMLDPCRHLSQKQRKIFRLLLAAGADGNAYGGKYGTALQAAAHHGGKSLVEELLQHKPKIDVNALGGYYGTALQAAAVIQGGEKVVELLLEHKADPSSRGGAYGSPLLAASTKGHKKVAGLLLRRGADTEATHSESGLTALLVAVERRDIDLVSLLLQHKANLETVDKQGRTALLLATGGGNTQLSRVLVDGGANKEAREPNSRRTPLLVETDRGNRDVLLLEKGADVNAVGGGYGNAMRAALYRHDVEAQEMIKSFGGTAEITTGS
ncbi:ankyrin repeat-containing domain protein [Dichotomopilus funicola]|uniref:Ankyrin repeat-containing domain protein n=1 Tax=Dichotomopilus funicola TaxID=1934379 RepID=A0AAN6V5J9_9PEZI|nr:ankyrin repeat-containing domain protein [Dichotomopilus funicola]